MNEHDNPYAAPATGLDPQSGVDPKLVGIGGWLILPAIGLVLGPLLGIPLLLFALTQYEAVAAAGFGGLFVLELGVQALSILMLIYAASRFFPKKSDAPMVMIMIIAAGVFLQGFLLMVELNSGAEEFAAESGKQLVRSIISAAIWIPYFNISKRVKATFVN